MGRRRRDRPTRRSGRARVPGPAPALLLPPPLERPEGPVHDALVERLATAGASFWPELLGAAGNAPEPEVLAALWDLVWSGHVTNDGLAPLRAQLGRGRTARRADRRARGPAGCAGSGRPPGAGRWSLVRTGAEADVTPTARAHALAHAAARTPRRRHPRGRARRGHRRRVRRGVSGAARAGGVGQGPARLLRRRARRRAVRAARRGRPAPHPPQPGSRRRATGARGHRSRPALRRGAAVAGATRGRRPDGSAEPPPAPTSCCATARSSRTSSGAAAPSPRSRPTPDWCGALLTLVKDGRLRQIELTHDRRATGARAPPRRGLARRRRPRHPRGLVVRGWPSSSTRRDSAAHRPVDRPRHDEPVRASRGRSRRRARSDRASSSPSIVAPHSSGASRSATTRQ